MGMNSPPIDRQTALALGERHYTGKPCPLHPSALRSVHNKACIECERIKGKARKAAVSYAESERKRAWKLAHPDRVKAEKARYRQNHKAELNAKRKAMPKPPIDPVKAETSRLAALWREHERQEARKARLADKADALREAHAIRYAASMMLDIKGHPMTPRALYDRVKRGRRRATRLGRICTLVVFDLVAIGDAQGWRCAHCGAASMLTLDHIKPLSLGGHHTRANVQWLCHFHNQDKRTMDEPDYRRLRGIPERTPWDAPRSL